MKKMIIAAAVCLTTTLHAEDLQKITDPNFIIAGENDGWRMHYDKNITYQANRKQATVYLLIQSKKTKQITVNQSTYDYNMILQRTDILCEQKIYIAQLMTIFDKSTGEIVSEGATGKPYKINVGSLVFPVMNEICTKMGAPL
jgi:hypothetical protein